MALVNQSRLNQRINKEQLNYELVSNQDWPQQTAYKIRMKKTIGHSL